MTRPSTHKAGPVECRTSRSTRRLRRMNDGPHSARTSVLNGCLAMNYFRDTGSHDAFQNSRGQKQQKERKHDKKTSVTRQATAAIRVL